MPLICYLESRAILSRQPMSRSVAGQSASHPAREYYSVTEDITGSACPNQRRRGSFVQWGATMTSKLFVLIERVRFLDGYSSASARCLTSGLPRAATTRVSQARHRPQDNGHCTRSTETSETIFVATIQLQQAPGKQRSRAISSSKPDRLVCDTPSWGGDAPSYQATILAAIDPRTVWRDRERTATSSSGVQLG